jgi:hypothetical protein
MSFPATVSGSPESIIAALETSVARMLEAKGIAVPTPAIATEQPKAESKPVRQPRDGAPWYELLAVLVEWAKANNELLRVLLIGPPGAGKSTTALKLTGTKHRVTFTEGMGVEDLTGMFLLQDGATVWSDGPIVTAMRRGECVLCDEIDHHPTEVSSGLYGWIDDQPHASLQNGELVIAKAGYGVIGTTNSSVTSLADAILDRFDVILSAIVPHPQALAQFEATMRDAVMNYFRTIDTSPWKWSRKPTLRPMRAFQKLRPVVGEVNAANMVFGSAGREMLGVLTTASRKKEDGGNTNAAL